MRSLAPEGAACLEPGDVGDECENEGCDRQGHQHRVQGMAGDGRGAFDAAVVGFSHDPLLLAYARETEARTMGSAAGHNEKGRPEPPFCPIWNV